MDAFKHVVFSIVPHVVGGGRIAELLLCDECPSGTVQERPAGDVTVQR